MASSFTAAAEGPTPTVRPSDRRVEVTEILDIAVAEDGGQIDLTMRASDGNVVPLRISQAAIAEALAQLSNKAALALETSTAAPGAKLNAPIGQWEIVRDVDAPLPTIECRTVQGHGVAVAFTYDPITAIPQLHVAVNL